MIIRKLALAALGAVALLSAAPAAHAEWYRPGYHDEWQDRRWRQIERERAWRHHEWREHHRFGYEQSYEQGPPPGAYRGRW